MNDLIQQLLRAAAEIGRGVYSPGHAALMQRAAKEIEAAEVRPVVRGHWIGTEEAEKIFEENYSDYPYGCCSVCGHCDWDCTESEGFNFCPNCGADMREERGN